MCKYCENSSEFELDSDRDLFEGRGLTTKLFIVNEGEDYYLQLVNDLTGEKIKTTKIQVCPVCYHVLGTSYVPEKRDEVCEFFSNLSDCTSASIVEEAWKNVPKFEGWCVCGAQSNYPYYPHTGCIPPTAFGPTPPDYKNEDPLLGYSRNSALVDMINATYSGLGEIDREVLQ
jgi:hypothetical protein